MEQRLHIHSLQPQGIEAMKGLEHYLSATQLSRQHKELIKVRASQINGCAFCIDLHTKDALSYGESPQRLFLLNAWREVDDLFSEEEQALLAVTEDITLIHQNGLSEATYERARAVFDDTYLAQVIMAAVTINAWNRIAISTRMQPLH